MMTHREIERRIAEEIVGLLDSNRGGASGTLRWMDSKTHLVEVVRYVYLSEMMRDENGFPLSQKVIAERVFSLFGMPLPRNINCYLTRLYSYKGVRSQRLADILYYRINERNQEFSLSLYIRNCLVV